MIGAIRELILPQTTIIIPNSMEARRLAELLGDIGPPSAGSDAMIPIRPSLHRER